MRTRTLIATGLVAVVSAGVTAPSMAATKPKPKPKPISGSFTATATPDPTSNNTTTMQGTLTCNPTIPSARVTKTFVVPAAGTLEVKANNKLDWTMDLRDSTGEELASSDGGTPTDPESYAVTFKKKTTVTIGVCNFSGEPTITPSYVFTYK